MDKITFSNVPIKDGHTHTNYSFWSHVAMSRLFLRRIGQKGPVWVEPRGKKHAKPIMKNEMWHAPMEANHMSEPGRFRMPQKRLPKA